MDLEEDWSDLCLRKPVEPTGEPLEDLVEDWDVLQGKNSWFVALYDSQYKLIPGSSMRVESIEGDIIWDRIPSEGQAHAIGYWSRFQRVQFARFDKPLDITRGQSVGLKLRFNYSTMPIQFSGMSSATNTLTIPFSNLTNSFTISSSINSTNYTFTIA